MSALTSNQLFTMPDTDFQTAIKGMSTKSLIETITVLQKEMSKEQENFNSLSSELGGLKKNSGQYKSISKDLSSSQTRLTLLMNRSMKCFNQQGSKSKTPTEKTAPKISVNKATDQSKPVIVTQSAANRAPVQANGAAKPVNRSASTSNGKTMIKVQSLTQNSPRLQMGDVNSSNNDSMNKLSFGEKMGIVSNALPLSQSAGNLESLRTESPRTPVDNEPKSFSNGKLGSVVTSKSKEDVSSVVKTGPIDDQRSKYISSSADNVSKPDANKPEVVKSSIKPTKPATKVVLNADKHMIDLDSFTDRKNMLSELKSFDKQLKPVQKSTTVNQVKLSVGERNGNKDETTDTGKVNGTEQANPKSVLLKDIQLAKKPSELKETKAEPVKQTWNGNNKTQAKANSNYATQMFDDLLKGVDSATDSESSENSPREVTIVETMKVETKVAEALKETEMDIPKGVDTKSAPLSEISFAGTRQVTTIEEESEDNGTDSEDDRFVSEFQFPGKPKSAEKAKQKTGKWKLSY